MAQHTIHCGLWVGYFPGLMADWKLWLDATQEKNCAGWCPLKHVCAIVKLKDLKYWGLPHSHPSRYSFWNVLSA